MVDVPRSRYVLFLAIAATGFLIDQGTKNWLFSWPELRRGKCTGSSTAMPGFS